MNSLEKFNEFCRLTGQATLGDLTTEQLRSQTDRFTLDRVCKYCEHVVSGGAKQCRNCGARP